MTFPKLNPKTVGDIAVKTVVSCAGLWATGYWVGWGFQDGRKTSDSLSELRAMRRAKKQLEKINKVLEDLKKKGQDGKWTDEDTGSLVEIYEQMSEFYEEDDPSMLGLSDWIQNVKAGGKK